MNKMLYLDPEGQVIAGYPSIDAIRRLSEYERINIIQREQTLIHPAFCKAMNHVMWMVKHHPKDRAPGLIVSGPNGSGKTTFGNVMLQQYALLPPSASLENKKPCAVMISLSGLTTMRAVYGRILESINAPVNGYQRIADREIIVMRTLRLINCRLLILDEVQDLLKATVREQQRVLDAIKFIMWSLKIPVVALGTERTARAFDADSHLQARFEEIGFPHWACDDNLLDLLASIEEMLPLRGVVKLRTQEMVERILELSDGCLGVIFEVIRNAAIEAIATSKETLTVDSLRSIQDLPDHHCLDLPIPMRTKSAK